MKVEGSSHVHILRSSPWPLDSVKSLYHIDGGGCDYAKGTGSSAQRLHAILADRSCRTQWPLTRVAARGAGARGDGRPWRGDRRLRAVRGEGGPQRPVWRLREQHPAVVGVLPQVAEARDATKNFIIRITDYAGASEF